VKTIRVSKVSKRRRSAEAGEALRPRVVEAARELFFSRGFVRVTADEIAGRLGISKATLYKSFASKEEILRAVVADFLERTLAHIEELLGDATAGFVDKLVAMFAFVGGRISLFGPLLVQDLQKSTPRIWREIDAFRREKIYKNFKVILESGRREGLFRGDVDVDVLVEMFADLVGRFVNPEAILRSGRSPAEAFASIIKVFFQGILTERGRRDFSTRTPALFEPRKEGAT
jgi:AcrR family transcriptional regulator